eukprot:UC1_evm1s71
MFWKGAAAAAAAGGSAVVAPVSPNGLPQGHGCVHGGSVGTGGVVGVAGGGRGGGGGGGGGLLLHSGGGLTVLRDKTGARQKPDGSGLETELEVCERESVELTHALKAIHKRVILWDTEESGVFLLPVDVRIAPHYYKLVKKPMDLSRIGAKIASRSYGSAWEYLEDMWLMLDNCCFFNRPGSFHHRYASRLRNMWSPWAERLMTHTLAGHDYCCGRRRYLSGVSYRCRGGTCFVKYGAQYWHYQLDNDEELIYCQSHYAKLPAEVTLPRYGNGTGGDITFYKADLVRRKHNTPLVEERMVSCERCGRRHHEICVMYNMYTGAPYICQR